MAGIPERHHRVNFNCPDSLLEPLQLLCDQQNRSIAWMLKHLIAGHLQKTIPVEALKLDADYLRASLLPTSEQLEPACEGPAERFDYSEEEQEEIDPRLL